MLVTNELGAFEIPCACACDDSSAQTPNRQADRTSAPRSNRQSKQSPGHWVGQMTASLPGVQTRILFVGNGLATQPHFTPAQSSRRRTDHDELQIRRRQRLLCQARLTRLGQIGSMPCLLYVPPVGADA